MEREGGVRVLDEGEGGERDRTRARVCGDGQSGDLNVVEKKVAEGALRTKTRITLGGHRLYFERMSTGERTWILERLSALRCPYYVTETFVSFRPDKYFSALYELARSRDNINGEEKEEHADADKGEVGCGKGGKRHC